ncbi:MULTISPECIES: hypothetical protein [Rhizobium/Agrobacterium group]|jgi:hypothetical protein|uniref:Uncharacterized protein n=5 Tax=Agrobacterium TaxID=357 RepID=A0A1B9SRA1_AGRTU|nr:MULTISPECIES: hypothetical protein [Rhizobium/Agrobacterium group]MCP2134694.1 hypothetical protein [Rhizobium sp. SLBN-94]MCZ7496104.1 hypothetical protein [Rhizobium rhizogenes]TGE80126.1 hypothetical protein C9410_07535 [Rhizobium sp. SEMIA 439]AVH41721.1 hypothetical protein At1D1609_16670 [Agrobacterium tumefaciens]AYM81158.1 hypothetical protein At12D1_12710 [Agrobacterium tumefaciens]
MKSVLIIAAVFGFSASAALAECAGHQQINASVPAVDREFKTASIVPPTDPVEKPVVILKKTDRLPAAVATTGEPEAAMQRMQ